VRKDLKSIWRSKIRRPIPREFLSSNTTIDNGKEISLSNKSKRSLVVYGIIFIEVEPKRNSYEDPNLIYENTTFNRIFVNRSGSPALLIPARLARGGDDLWREWKWRRL
jgi:hypothetical protein